MCFRRKKTKKLGNVITKQSVFRIPQIIKVYGLKKENKYKPTSAVSPIFGRNIKDGFIPQSMINRMDDVRERYDAFRKVKKVSKEELIEKYGTIYREFPNIHTNESSEKYLGQKIYIPKDEEIPSIYENSKIDPITDNFTNDIKKKDEEDLKNNFSTDKNLNYGDDYDDIDINDADLALTEDELNELNNSEYFSEDEEIPDFLKPEAKTYSRPKMTDYNTNLYEENIKEETTVKRPRESRLPSVNLFSKSDITLNDRPQWLLDHISAINDTLNEFGFDGRVVKSTKGPTVTRYEIEIERGINVKKILNISDNFKMNLKVKDIRIEAPIPGKKYIGIEVPNLKPEIVLFGNCVSNPEFLNDNNNNLKVVLGQDIDGKYIYADIENMPHCLIAGATNSGKSVCVNALILSLLLKNTADDLKLILIDPKMVELNAYNDLPHLITPIISDPKVAAFSLKWAVNEMERRYQILSENRSKDIKSYNMKVEIGEINSKKMPNIVILIDEYADLMSVAANDVETAIQRLVSKSRAAGIHLILATQRPTTNVIKGVIKANITTRIAFRVASYVDSITILDESGAENLLGRGDMLYSSIEQPHRIQGAYVPENEIYSAVDFIRRNERPEYVFTHDELIHISKPLEKVEDEMFEEVAKFVVDIQSASANLIQREFNMGFNRAQKLLDALENYNIIAPSKGNNQPREVLVSPMQLRAILGYDD